MKSLLLSILLITSCGMNGEQKITTNDSKQTVDVSGEAYSYVIIRLEFLQQIKDLCEDKYLKSDFASIELYKQQVATCVFDNLSLLNMSKINSFQDKWCVANPDYSGLTPDQISNIIAACAALQ